MQVTALGNPKLLERVSNTLSELHKLFERFDTDDSGFITKDKFFRVSRIPPAFFVRLPDAEQLHSLLALLVKLHRLSKLLVSGLVM